MCANTSMALRTKVEHAPTLVSTKECLVVEEGASAVEASRKELGKGVRSEEGEYNNNNTQLPK